MLNVRVVTPAGRSDDLLTTLLGDGAVCNVVVLPGAARHPDGDVVSFDVAPEHADGLLTALRAGGLDRDGSIAIERVDAMFSAAARRAEAAAPGDPGEAVVWDEVEERVRQESQLTVSFCVFLVIAVLIGAVGILVDSAVLIVGAMVTGPEYGPVAAVALGVHLRSREHVRRGLVALAVGFPPAIAAAAVLAAIVRAVDTVPAGFVSDRPLTSFISHPDGFSVVVALLAGVAGVLSLTEAKAGTLVGVLISVTTVPAASNIGVSLAFGNRSELVGATLQLLVNLVCLVVAGAATLTVQRRLLARDRGRTRPADRLSARSDPPTGS